MMNKPNPCPRCGCAPAIMRVGDYKQLQVYVCHACGWKTDYYGDGRLTERGARKIWNRRVRGYKG